MSTLREIQQRMGNAVMHPLTANDQAPRRLKAEAEAIIKKNDRLSSLERLEIYNRSYWFRVLDSLVEDFPGVRAIDGGKLENARIVEQITALLIGLNIRHKGHGGIRITGLPASSYRSSS